MNCFAAGHTGCLQPLLQPALQLLEQLLVGLVENGLHAHSAGSFHIGRNVVDKQALLGQKSPAFQQQAVDPGFRLKHLMIAGMYRQKLKLAIVSLIRRKRLCGSWR